MNPADRAFELVNGFRFSQLVYAAVELRIPDLLAQGPRSDDELSVATGIDLIRLRRLLRGLVAIGVLVQPDDGRFANTEVGRLFREDGSVEPARLRMLIPESYQNWGHFMQTLRTGVTGQSLAHGATLWELIARDPDFASRFNQAMASGSEEIADFVARSIDFTRAALVVDVGGGKGALIAGILLAHTHLRGVVCDVSAGLTDTSRYLAERGLTDRCVALEADFFDSVPAGDVYLLKDILHDWPDDRAAAILRVCRRAMAPGSRVVVIERVLPSRVTAIPAHLNAAIIDLQMMVQLGGRERTIDEYRQLLAAAALTVSLVASDEPYQAIEATAV